MFKKSGPRSLRTKIIYLFIALVTVALTVPGMATTAFGVPNDPAIVPAEAFNVSGSIERFTVTGFTGTVAFSVMDVIPGTGATIVGTGANQDGTKWVDVQAGGAGEATIKAVLTEGPTLYAEKKWVQIGYTTISDPQSVPVQWDEPNKMWSATVSVTDTVWGRFVNKDGLIFDPTKLGGAVINWWLVPASVQVPMACGIGADLVATMNGLTPATYTHFVNAGTHIVTNSFDSDPDGSSTVQITTNAEEAVKVVVVATYPTPINVPVCPEVTSVNFWTQEWEKVPQVAWAGDKVVLEKNFGVRNAIVRFALENQSPGTLEPISAGLGGLTGDSQTVWTETNSCGVASVTVHSEDPGEVDVLATAWWGSDKISGPADNQHAFVVYFLKFEDLSLSNVVGKRAGHNTGMFEPANPWDASQDVLAETLNVSQDALLRTVVRGYFENAQDSTRPARPIVNGPTQVVLPAGRWILPDDWAALAGPDWQELRIHWDIMDAPQDTVVSFPTPPAGTPLGPYNAKGGNTVLPVIGPFSPGIEMMTPTGYKTTSTAGTDNKQDPARNIQTVVPNGALDKWDAPMPPAKIIYKINSGPGFLKGVNKADVYYIKGPNGIEYTNPFYAVNIPAHEAIPAFINNGGYDWSSFGNPAPVYGPYPFWQIINQPSQGAPVASYGPILATKDSQGNVINPGVPNADWAGHPTKVEVYSDNHGEAMVYLNGFWNLNLSAYITNGAYDVPPGTEVGTTVVQALADYPYLRKHEAMQSNTVSKTWTWGKRILGTDPADYPNGTVDSVPAAQRDDLSMSAGGTRMVIQTGTLTDLQGTFPYETAMSDKKMAWVWVTNPDGFPGVGEKVDWTVEQASGSGANIPDITGIGVSEYNDITKAIATEHGFLSGTGGTLLNVERTIGRSWTRVPTAKEKELFEKFYPALDADDYAVAAVEITSSLGSLVDLQISINEGILGTIRRDTLLDFSSADPADDAPKAGDANQDGVLNMGDVTIVERMILGLAPPTTQITYYMPLDMGAVIKIERAILGK